MVKNASKKRFVVANWKMYVDSPEKAKAFAQKLKRRAALLSNLEILLAPPFVLITGLLAVLKNSKIKIGAQTVSSFENGAHTGEISGNLLRDSGATFVIVGHSERRARGESDTEIANSLLRGQNAGLRTILCIGEKERDQSGVHFEFLAAQLRAALTSFPRSAAPKSLMIAYEPLWAIGKTSQDAMKPGDLRETSIFIRKQLSQLLGREVAMQVPILYGGSVEGDNARALIEQGDVSGFLVGHASATIDSFLSIIAACGR